MNLKTGLYKNGFELYSCICGSVVQSRNISNHFSTYKHKKFLLNCSDLVEDYKDLTRSESHLKILSHQKKRYLQKIEFPIVLHFD